MHRNRNYLGFITMNINKMTTINSFQMLSFSFKDFYKNFSGNSFHTANSRILEFLSIEDGSMSTDKHPSTAS